MNNLTRFSVISIIFLVYSVNLAFADELSNVLQQRIGDYDIKINTVPKIPISGKDTHISMKISTVSNNPVIDTPLVFRISDERNELIRTQPVLLSSGHYSINHNFNNSGIFVLSIDILDNSALGDSNDSNGMLTFDFPIRVSEPFSVDMANFALPIIIASVGFIGSLIALKKLKKSKSIT